jgi:hypothetical protein
MPTSRAAPLNRYTSQRISCEPGSRRRPPNAISFKVCEVKLRTVSFGRAGQGASGLTVSSSYHIYI